MQFLHRPNMPVLRNVTGPKSPTTLCSLAQVDIHLEEEACFAAHPPRKVAFFLIRTKTGSWPKLKIPSRQKPWLGCSSVDTKISTACLTLSCQSGPATPKFQGWESSPLSPGWPSFLNGLIIPNHRLNYDYMLPANLSKHLCHNRRFQHALLQDLLNNEWYTLEVVPWFKEVRYG